MKRIFSYTICFIFSCLLMMGAVGVRAIFGVEIDSKTIEDKKERKEEIADEKKELTQDLKEVRKKKLAAWEHYNIINRNLDATDARLRIKEKELERKKNQKKITSDILERTKKDLDETQSNFESALRMYYKFGPRGMLNLIIDAKDMSDLAQRIKYTEYLLKSYEEMIYKIREQQALLKKQEEKLTEEVKEEKALYNEIWELRTSYNQQRNETKELIRRIQQDEREISAALAELEREEMEIEFFLTAAAKGNLITNFDGTFSRPLQSYLVTSGFGMRKHPILKRRRMHNGIDLSAPYGTPVLASGAGRVIYVGWKNGYGNVIMIDHGKGFATLYAHMSAFFVSVGQDVAEGQPIGRVGSTGWSTGNHLHFEIRKNGQATNPTGWVNF